MNNSQVPRRPQIVTGQFQTTAAGLLAPNQNQSGVTRQFGRSDSTRPNAEKLRQVYGYEIQGGRLYELKGANQSQRLVPSDVAIRTPAANSPMANFLGGDNLVLENKILLKSQDAQDLRNSFRIYFPEDFAKEQIEIDKGKERDKEKEKVIMADLLHKKSNGVNLNYSDIYPHEMTFTGKTKLLVDKNGNFLTDISTGKPKPKDSYYFGFCYPDLRIHERSKPDGGKIKFSQYWQTDNGTSLLLAKGEPCNKLTDKIKESMIRGFKNNLRAVIEMAKEQGRAFAFPLPAPDAFIEGLEEIQKKEAKSKIIECFARAVHSMREDADFKAWISDIIFVGGKNTWGDVYSSFKDQDVYANSITGARTIDFKTATGVHCPCHLADVDLSEISDYCPFPIMANPKEVLGSKAMQNIHKDSIATDEPYAIQTLGSFIPFANQHFRDLAEKLKTSLVVGDDKTAQDLIKAHNQSGLSSRPASIVIESKADQELKRNLIDALAEEKIKPGSGVSKIGFFSGTNEIKDEELALLKSDRTPSKVLEFGRKAAAKALVSVLDSQKTKTLPDNLYYGIGAEGNLMKSDEGNFVLTITKPFIGCDPELSKIFQQTGDGNKPVYITQIEVQQPDGKYQLKTLQEIFTDADGKAMSQSAATQKLLEIIRSRNAQDLKFVYSADAAGSNSQTTTIKKQVLATKANNQAGFQAQVEQKINERKAGNKNHNNCSDLGIAYIPAAFGLSENNLPLPDSVKTEYNKILKDLSADRRPSVDPTKPLTSSQIAALAGKQNGIEKSQTTSTR